MTFNDIVNEALRAIGADDTALTQPEVWIEFDRAYGGEAVSIGMRINTGITLLGTLPDGTKIRSSFDTETKEVVWEYLV